MRSKIRFSALALSFLLVFPAFAGCSPQNGSPSTTTEPASQPQAPIVIDGEYRVIRPDGDTFETVSIAETLVADIASAFGLTLSLTDDFLSRGEAVPDMAKEILIGVTNRSESIRARLSLGSLDWSVSVSGDRIIIVGGSEEALASAAGYFVSDVLKKDSSGTLTVAGDFSYIHSDPAGTVNILQSLSVSGNDISKYSVIYGKDAISSEKTAAQKLCTTINRKLAAGVALLDDSTAETEFEIIVGHTTRLDETAYSYYSTESCISVSSNKLIIGGGSVAAVTSAVQYFIDEYLSAVTGALNLESGDGEKGIIMKNPLRTESSGDPCITYDSETGYYYAVYSSSKSDTITLYRAKKLSELGSAEGKTVYTIGKEIKSKIYAPEIHKVDGKWYIYASGATAESDIALTVSKSIRLFCIEAVTDDPYGEYAFKGFLSRTINAIDAHVFYNEATGKYYACYAEVYTGNGNEIGIAELSDPWTINELKRARISKATYAFETMDGKVNEGPFVFSHDGKLFLLYSANNVSSDYYCLGLLVCTDTSNPVSSASWTKLTTAAFSGTDAVLSPGHCSVFLSPDGSEYWLAYHYRNSSTRVRELCVQKFTFGEDGLPVFGEPTGPYVSFMSPSGE